MKDIISYKTALALKEAGFPQPKPEAGQVWYNNNGDAVIYLRSGFAPADGFVSIGDYFHLVYDTSVNYCVESSIRSSLDISIESFLSNHCYASSATDLLRELPQMSLTYYFIEEADPSWWDVEFYDTITPEGQSLSEHPTNPAEALAAAWLEKNKKQ